MAFAVVGLLEEIAGQIAHIRTLTESALCMQQFYARQKSTVLVLPAAAGGEQLFENECAVANLGLVPAESAEVAERSEHRRREQRAGAESASGWYRRE